MKRLTWSLALVVTNLLGIALVVAMIERERVDARVLVPITLAFFLLILWVKKQRDRRDERLPGEPDTLPWPSRKHTP